MKSGLALAMVAALLALSLPGSDAQAGAGMRHPRFAAEDGGDGNKNVNIIVRQVSFTPAVAHVGDTIRFEVVVEDVDEGYTSIPAQILANGKRVAGGLFTFGWSKGNRLYRESFDWNTAGAAAGEYRIKADYFMLEDSSPFDNEMTVTQPLILLPAGAPYPEGKPGGGTATEKDPRWKEKRVSG